MAGTAYAGAVDTDNLGATTIAMFLGQNRGTAPFSSNWNTSDRPSLLMDGVEVINGVRTADTQTDGSGSATEVAHAGATHVEMGAGGNWYDDLHILPRTALDFGNIITQVTNEYEIYNAYRSASVSLTTVNLGAVQPGVTTPEMTPTYVIEPSASAFDSTTTENSTGVGLGTIVKLEVVVSADGLPTFDGDIVFSGGGESVSLRVAGSRIVLMPMIYESPVKETLE